MIPADVASRLQLAADANLRQVAPSQEISDKLSDLIPGQRVLAEIQALLPNGTYRAIINQRDITLALPFSAKAGDSLELEVVDSDGKISLAVISRPTSKEIANLPSESVPTTLSRTGQLIGNLLAKDSEGKSTLTPTPLNGNQPIAAAPPRTAQDLIPLLKQAITQSGMFYESHQADWAGGQLDKAALLQEPQGKLPPTHPPPLALSSGQPDFAAGAAADSWQLQGVGPETGNNRTSPTTPSAQTLSPPHIVAPEVLPLVQQQLEALATQNFSWHGQVWPGQEMRWEIEEDAAQREQASDDTASNWQTRLRLTLPHLGEVDAQIRLQGNQISLALMAGNLETQELLRASTNTLRSQLDDAGLALAAIGVSAVTIEGADGQATN